MKWIPITLTAMLVSLAGCDTGKDTADLDGGACEYTAYEGTCYGESDGTFRFEGSVDGEDFSLAGNGGEAEVADGESADCSLEFIETGSCTPCVLDIGECGSEAWDLFQSGE